MKALKHLSSRAVPLPAENIDTDQIIPARFLTTTARSGLGRHLFADWRLAGDGTPRRDCALNDSRFRGAEILVAGHNFGCGSSREHAVWALLDYGFRDVIRSRFADIFHANALRTGLVAIEVPVAVQQQLLREVEQDPELIISIDLEARSLTYPDRPPVSFTIDPFARHCIMQGLDELGYLLDRLPEIEQYEALHGARVDTLGGVV
jgi:3-isopropylmalate/(R)-2-methylmalate dehydratase small subunit